MNSDIKILVVEDEMIIGAKISMFLTELGYEVTGIVPRAEEALLHLVENPPHLVLLDIQLKGKMDGIDLAKVLRQDYGIPVIFLTANTDDATFIKAKEAKPYAFLTKPFKKLDLKRTLELTVSLISDEIAEREKKNKVTETISPPILPDRIFVYHQENKVKIMFDAILYVQAERSYCRVVTKEKEYLLTMPMKNLEDELPTAIFQRIHRSYLVNLHHVNEIGETMIKVGDKYLGISKSYRKEFLLRVKSV